MTRTTWLTIFALITVTYAFRWLGVRLAQRSRDAHFMDLTVLIAVGLLAALAATQTLFLERRLVLDARVFGVATSIFLAVRGHSLLMVFGAGVLVTAATRAIGHL